MIDPKTSQLDLSIAGRDFTIKQSPGVLQSSRGGGTTASAVWQSSVRAAEWLAAPDNALFGQHLLNASSHVLELGAGISALVPCVLSPRVAAYLATDQAYALKLLQENLDGNLGSPLRGQKGRKISTKPMEASPKVQVVPLDWETTDAPSLLKAYGFDNGVDVVLSCDSIYNYALVEPFTQTCADLCSMRDTQSESDGEAAVEPTMCVVVQQLRQPEVFEEWLETFMGRFEVWRLPDNVLTADLSEGSGFAVHLAMLRKSAPR